MRLDWYFTKSLLASIHSKSLASCSCRSLRFLFYYISTHSLYSWFNNRIQLSMVVDPPFLKHVLPSSLLWSVMHLICSFLNVLSNYQQTASCWQDDPQNRPTSNETTTLLIDLISRLAPQLQTSAAFSHILKIETKQSPLLQGTPKIAGLQVNISLTWSLTCRFSPLSHYRESL